MPTTDWPQKIDDRIALQGDRARWLVWDVESGEEWSCWTQSTAEHIAEWLQEQGYQVDYDFLGW